MDRFLIRSVCGTKFLLRNEPMWLVCQRREQIPCRPKQVLSVIILFLVLSMVREQCTNENSATSRSGTLTIKTSSPSSSASVSNTSLLGIQNIRGVQVAVVKACVGNAFSRISSASLENGRNYSKVHNYEFLEVNENTFPATTFFTPPAWLKVAYLHYLLVSRSTLDWILWLDCDTLVLRPHVSVESVLQS